MSSPARYEFRVIGRMSDTAAAAFAELEKTAAPTETILFGPVVDDAHLHGLLLRFQTMGLRVVEMRRLPD